MPISFFPIGRVVSSHVLFFSIGWIFITLIHFSSLATSSYEIRSQYANKQKLTKAWLVISFKVICYDQEILPY